MKALGFSAVLLISLHAVAQQTLPSRDAKIALFRQHGEDAASAMTALGKAECAKADSTMAMDTCLQSFTAKADRYYRTFAVSLGGLIRLQVSSPDSIRPQASAGRQPFDEGETAWLRYRDQTCGEQFALADGGTMGPVSELACELTLTVSHVRELRELYSELWR